MGPDRGRASAGSSCPRTRQGFSAPVIHKKLSLRASVTCELVLEGVRLPADAVLPDAAGLRGPLSLPDRGALRHRVRRARRGAGLPRDGDRLRARPGTQFDRPIAGFQLTQAKLADMALELQKGFLLALHLGRLKDAGTA